MMSDTAALTHPAGDDSEHGLCSSQDAVRLFCISDVHVDIPQNKKWIEQLPARPNDALIVAGDISEQMDLTQSALRVLKRKYAEVFCVPGNHDLWLNRGETDSMDKLHAFLAMCDSEGVRTRPHRIGMSSDGTGGVWVVPLLSWHHQSFDTEPDITGWGGIPGPEIAMTDYRRCRWPPPLRPGDDSVAQAVDALNEGRAELPAIGASGGAAVPIISFSHFVPRVELTPEKRFLYLPTLSKAVGSRFLEERLRRLGSCMHVFGHTHFGWDASLDGVRYVQAALGYPFEWRERPASMEVGALPREPVLLWESGSGLVPQMPHSEHLPWRPEICSALAPYVAPRYKQLEGGTICEMPILAA